MKEIKFRPLRRIKNSGKATVTGYMQWRKLMTANEHCEYFGGEFLLDAIKDFSEFDKNERVYNHKGELLFWYNYDDPESLPKNFPGKEVVEFLRQDGEVEEWKIDILEKQPIGIGFHWSVRGFDCDGVPCFSHYDWNYCAGHQDVSQFDVLTVGTVLKWYGWILWKLNNSKLI